MKILTLSFDDCEIHDRRLCELLRKYDLRATFYLLSGLLGQKVPFRRYGENTVVERVTAEELPSTYAGMEIGCHTRFHKFTDESLEADIALSMAELSEAWGQPVKGFAYPGGFYTQAQLLRLKQTDVVYARGASPNHSFTVPEDWYQWQPTCHYADPNLPALLDIFFALPEKTDAVFHIYGHSYELTQPDPSKNWNYLDELFQTLAHRPGIHYATNLEAWQLLTTPK